MKKFPARACIVLSFLIFSIFVVDRKTLFAEDSYADWVRSEIGGFQEFKDKRDKEFVNFLKKEWQEFQVERGLVRDSSPKPVDRPVARKSPSDEPVVPPQDAKKIIKDIPLPMEYKTKKPDLKNLPALRKAQASETLNVNFFGTSVSVKYDREMRVQAISDVSKTGISSFWEDLSRSKYEEFLSQLHAIRNEIVLNDWGFLLLAQKIGRQLFPEDENTSVLFVWFLMAKSGYDTRIGYNETRLYLLLSSENVMYETPNFMLDGTRFYATSLYGKTEKAGSIYTYKGDYPGADKKLNFTVKQFPKISSATKARELRFQYAGQDFLVSAEYNRALIEFLDSYPQTDLEVYFNSSISPEASYSLVRGLKPVIEGKSEVDAVNTILRFVQTAFEYQTDGEQFGKEKYFFREETLFYPFSDCEDRSILFAYLVKELIGLDVVVLDFPGHIATAVRFNEKVLGDSVFFDGAEYLICDPTYINANVGMKMKKFENMTPRVTEIKL
ncbi:MAG: hypothetical protein ACE5FU_07290 [Nitrospinota bacterium]